MSIWNIGKDDISEQTQALKNTASSKEIENAGLRNQLLKRDSELNELKSTLNETLHKLSREADRALRLEADLAHISEDLAYHKVTSQNAEQTFAAANAKLRASELNERELQNHLEMLSHRQDEAKDGTLKLEKEKKVLEARVKELDAQVRQLSAPTSGIQRKTGRPRSSSVSMMNVKNTVMEQELSDIRASLTAKEGELCTAHEKLGRAQTELVQTQNERIAMERKMKKQLSELEASLEEKEDELEGIRAQQGDGGREREEELMKRVEEDEAKILALEMLVGETYKLASVKDALGRAEKQLKVESKKAEDSEKRCVELVRQKEELFGKLEQAKRNIHDRDARTQATSVKEKELQTQMMSLQAEPNSILPPSADSNATTYIATLLGAIDRLRGERDDLRRDLNFLETENKFAIQALEAKVESAAPMKKPFEHETVTLEQEQHIKRLSLAATASAIVVGHLQLRLEDLSAHFTSRLADALQACEHKESFSRDLQAKLDAAVRDFDLAQKQSSDLFSQSELNVHIVSDEAQSLKVAHQEAKEALDQAEARLSDLAKSFEQVESQRDSLHLQVTNLQSDLALAQEELAEAEARYSTLQTQQLSSMSSNEVARSLLEQIEELEMRVLRRTDQIGIHQHDIKRLEINLRLQEERVGEMTSELETLGEQKEAMVWDCADAREARDKAIRKCENLEVEVEALEGRLEKTESERQREVVAMIEVIVETSVRSRTALDTLRRRPVNNIGAAQAQQATLALAVAQVELKNKSASLEVSKKAKTDLQVRIAGLEENLNRKIVDTKCLEQQLIDLRQRSDAKAISKSQTVDQLREEHTEQMNSLQKMLDSSANELREAKALHSDAEVRHQQALEEANRSKVELENRLAGALERMQGEGVLEKVRRDHTEEVGRLEEQIRQAEDQLQDIIRSHAELETLYQSTLTDFTRTNEDHKARLSRATLQSLDATRQLEDDLANTKFKHAEDMGELEGQLKHSVEEVGRLQVRLQEEIDSRDKERQAHTLELQSKAEECRCAESLEAELHQEIAVTRTQLDQTRTALQALEAEKSALQIKTTNLGAEIQRAISLNQSTESEIKACQGRNATLQEALDHTRGELSRSEKSGKEAEINLSLQSVRHDQIISGLRRELAALKALPKLDDVVAELEEKNRDMDELLKSKCAEIEENDDRILEMLKDKKKLTTKVESLTRKVQTLQNRLAASVPEPNVEKVISPLSRPVPSSTVTPIPLSNPIPPVHQKPTYDPRTPVSLPLRNRVVSGPASLPRPKTPECRSAQPAVFKARTPEKRATPTATPPLTVGDSIQVSTSTSSVGKKRARPDEFDDVTVPVQALYAEQEREHVTPRLRRALHSVQAHTGFTPVRRTKAQLPHGAPSPDRRAVTMGIADVTNSLGAQTAKAGKRSWLGKIRGGSQTTSTRTPSSRPGVFERVPVS